MSYTYSKIATYTVGSGGVASISFLNIPQNYTDLHLITSLRSNRATVVYDTGIIRFNSDSGNNYVASRRLYGDGSSAFSDAPAITNSGLFEMPTASGATASTFGNMQIYIPNYTSSNYKSYSNDGVSENNATTSFTTLIAGLWNSTSAITSITITPFAGTLWNQYSTAHLYGVKAEL
jgi:hypothetical protein